MLERHLDLWKIIVRHIMYMWLFHHNYLQSHHLGHKVVQVDLDWECKCIANVEALNIWALNTYVKTVSNTFKSCLKRNVEHLQLQHVFYEFNRCSEVLRFVSFCVCVCAYVLQYESVLCLVYMCFLVCLLVPLVVR